MLKKFIPFFIVALFVLNGCVSDLFGPSFDEVNRSESGILIESLLPADTWLVLSFSTLDEEQQIYFQAMVDTFSDDPEALKEELFSGIDANLESVDLSYLEDIAPILGQEGVRFVLALSDADLEPVTHVALTLDDPTMAQDLFATLESAGRFVRTSYNNYDFYVNLTARDEEEDTFYFSVHEDVLLISNDDEELAEMLDLAKAEMAESLWTQEAYQLVLEELPATHLGMLFMDPQGGPGQFLEQSQNLKAQGFALVAHSDGLHLDGIVIGNEEVIDATDSPLNATNSHRHYLSKVMPGDGLGAYLESYNLASGLSEYLSIPSPQLNAGLALVGLGSPEELEELLGRGYALSLHANDGFLPGITVLLDASGNTEAAENLIKTLDEQLEGFVGQLVFQGGMEDSFLKDEMEVGGDMMHRIQFNWGEVMAVFYGTGSYMPPAEFQQETIQLIYGLLDGKRLVISTYDGWGDDPANLNQTETFKETMKALKGVREGLVYLDFVEVTTFVEHYQDFKEAALQAALESARAAEEAEAAEEGEMDEVTEIEETTEGVVEELALPEEFESIDWEKWLTPLKSFALSSDTGKYEVRMKGVLLLEE